MATKKTKTDEKAAKPAKTEKTSKKGTAKVAKAAKVAVKAAGGPLAKLKAAYGSKESLVGKIVEPLAGKDEDTDALKAMAECEKEFAAKPVNWVGVVSDTEPVDAVKQVVAEAGVKMPVLVDAGLRFTFSILIIASVNFLGLGLQPPSSDWARMIGENREDMRVTRWEKEQELRSGKSTIWDHTFHLPHRHLEAKQPTKDSVSAGKETHKLKLGPNDPLEVYDWPGRYREPAEGSRLG